MIVVTKQLVNRYPRISAVALVLGWFSVPLIAAEVMTWWYYALVNQKVGVPPEIAVPIHSSVQGAHSALRGPWFFIGYSAWAAIALIAAHCHALRKRRMAGRQDSRTSA